ncbi:hypothetical protein AHALO_1354 [Malaciobacter halophilus]|nr:hypothetical protein [Malaciobacter halophilus]AXH09726.1 hypothetical protein AHALO_1354 [Malaciobacter halophilus]
MTQEIQIINQAVDTYKEHYYPNMQLTQSEMIDFNDFVTDLIALKKEAQNIKSYNGDERYLTETINNHKFHIMSTSQKGFAVTIKNGDVSISFKRFKKITKQPCIKVEYRADYLARYGYVKCVTQMQSFLKEIIPHTYSIASEIHLCTDIQNYDFTIMDFFRMKTRSRKKEVYMEADSNAYFDGMKFTGFVLGAGNFMVRVYNKTHEIKKFPDKSFVKPSRWLVNDNYDENKEVWRIEVQIRRDKLKHLFNEKGYLENSTTCLNSIPDIWDLFMQKFEHKNLDDNSVIEIMKGYRTLKNGSKKILSKYAIRKRFQRSELSPVWNKIETFFHTKGKNLSYQEEISKPSVLYVKNSLKSVVSTLTKHMRGKFDPLLLADIFEEANEEQKKHKGFSIFDGARIKTIDYFNEAKVYYEKMSKQGLIIEDDFKKFENDLEKNILEVFSLAYLKDIPSKEALNEYNKRLGYEKRCS